MLHELKTDPFAFQSTIDGVKLYEIREDDRNFDVGDDLLLKETVHTGDAMAEGAPLQYTGRQVECEITHILYGPIYGLCRGWVIMSTDIIEIKDA